MPGLGNSNEEHDEPAAADSPQDTHDEPIADEQAPAETVVAPTDPQMAQPEAAEEQDIPQEQPETAAEAQTDVVTETAASTQERSDATAAIEANADTEDDEVGASDETDDDADLMADEPADNAVEGQPAGDAQPPKKIKRSEYKRGEIITVKVQEVTPTSIFVELDERGEGFTGLIPARELDRMSGDMMEMLQPGEEVQLYVVNTGDPNGNVILSLNRALEEIDWQRAEEFQKSREIYQGFVGGYNKGGLIVRFGRLRGFVPQSQISDERRARADGDTPEAKWSVMVREPITVKVIEVDRGRNRLILSERAAMRETREQRKAKLIEELTMNEVRTGRVVSLEDFGAFVDIGGAEGLIHLTELSWGHVTHPRQVLEVGEEITVEVISIDPKRKRIGLSLKRQQPDPWDVVASNYRQGELIKAEVTKLTKFGAFAQLVDQPEVEGLIHISELSENRVAHPREVVEVGEVLTLRIVKIDVADRRLGLSLKAVNSTEYLDSDMDFLFDDPDE